MFSKVSNKEIIEFTRVLSMLLYSKISMVGSLEIIIKQTRNENLNQVSKNILKDIKSGVSISKSFSKYPRLFSDIFIANLKVAEETGQIAEVVGEYSDFQKKMQELKRKILQAIRYPLLVLIVAVGVIFFMLIFIIPTFENLFLSVKAELPDITKLLIGLSSLVIDNSLLIIVMIILGTFLMVFALKTESVKRLIDKILIETPLISRIYLTNLLAQFSLSMSVLLKNKVPLIESLKISRNITGNQLFREQIDVVLKKTLRGETLSSNINSIKFFDVTFTKLLAVGEESAELDKVFFQLSNYYGSEFDHTLDNFTSLLEPALILFVGGIVAVILVGLYLPMFEIINYFGV
ncbi:type II secretion system F family protein [Bacteroidota bacterium]